MKLVLKVILGVVAFVALLYAYGQWISLFCSDTNFC